MFKFKWIKYAGTGGGTITYFGQLDDGRYFIATDFEDVAIVDSDPTEWYEYSIDGDDSSKWFDEHYIDGIYNWSEDWIEFFLDMYPFALNHTDNVSTSEIRRVKIYYNHFMDNISPDDYDDIEESKSIKRPSIMASKNSWKFVNVSPDYTGGNIYVYTGALSDGTYFIAEDGWLTVEIYDKDPRDDYDDSTYLPWQDEHRIRELGELESKDFFISMLDWIIENEPHDEFCNYNIHDMKKFRYELLND